MLLVSLPMRHVVLGASMTAAAIAQGLGGKQAGRDAFMCCCPAHEDRNPSLSVSEKDGKVLVKCFAGCGQSSVIDALIGLGLWQGTHDRRRGVDTTKRLGPIIAEYVYTDEQGHPILRVTRHSPKNFRQWRPNGDGGWTAGIGDSRRPLYRLPEVIEASIVFIVEGEKDADTLREMGFVATCNLMGAGKWRDEYNAVFAGKTVILIPDQDGPGRAHVLKVFKGVKPVAADVLCIDLETAKDVTEWFEEGHSEVELISLLESHWCRAEVNQGAARG